MNIPVKKLKNGFEIPIFGIGTWMMGGDFYKDLVNNDDEADIKAIQIAIDLGITHIDSSELYAQGRAEELTGMAIKKYDREKLFICTKVSPLNLHYHDLIKAAKGSLKRYQIDYLDLYLMHFPNKNIPLEETMPALDRLVDDGLIRYFGGSNFTVEQMKEAQTYAKHKFVANQYHYNLIVREPEKNGLLQYCQKNDIILIAWRPVQDTLSLQKGVEVLDKMCEKYGKTPIQMAINWLTSQYNVVTLAKSRNIEHLKENLGAVGWQMDKDDIEILRKYFPNQREIGDAWPGLDLYIKL
jgi:diketogulonate reductase-like aldo/keto reductase